MIFTPANGLNYETANAFCSVEYADDYFTLRGGESWLAAAQNIKEAALVKATDYIEQTYGQRFIGVVGNYPQALSWPRYSASIYDTDEIPEGLKKATCELALEALTGALNPVIDRSPQKRIKKVDVIEFEYSSNETALPLRPAVIGYLQPLLKGTTFNRPVVRK